MEKSSSRLKLFAILVAFMFAALTTRLWFLQVLASASARTQIQDQSVRVVRTDAPRGDIVDDHGRPLVDNRLSLEVRVNHQHLGDERRARSCRAVPRCSLPPCTRSGRGSTIRRYYDYQPKPVAVDVPEVVADYLKEHQSDFPGVEVVEASVRDYPNGTLAAHILGWVGQISADELKSSAFKSYGPNDLVGKAGLELQYEKYLRGQKGYEKFLLNALARTRASHRDAGRPFPGTTWSFPSTLRRSGSPRRRSRKGSRTPARSSTRRRARPRTSRRTPAR